MRKNQRLYDILAEKGFDGAIFCLPENVVHASGMTTFPNLYSANFFTWSLPLATVLMNVQDGSEILYVAESMAAEAERMSFFDEIRIFVPYRMDKNVDPVQEYARGLKEAVFECMPKTGILGVEAAGFPWGASAALKRLVLPSLEMKDVTGAVYESKMVKAPWELKRMRKAAAVIDAGMECFIRTAKKAGAGEIDLWKEILGAMYHKAGGHIPTSGELVTGERTFDAPYPGGPVPRRTKKGDVGLMDMSARVDGYWCDCCNIVSYGEKNETQLRYFEVIKNAYDYTTDALRSGATCSDVFRAAERAYTEQGFACPHYIGHSIGSGVNDMPKIIPCDHTVIEEGMCFSMEPGIYRQNMGLRIEKMLLVTKEGCEEFNQFEWGVGNE